MNLNELDNSTGVEAQLIWATKGNKLTRKYRCVVGQRRGRIVSKPGQCSAPINLKARLTLKKTKARMGKRMAKKAQRTKRFNPASKALKRLNKPLRRKR